jgi:hypothetical protein
MTFPELETVDEGMVRFLANFIRECGGMLQHLERTEQDSRGSTDGAALQRAVSGTLEKTDWATRQLLRFKPTAPVNP